MSYIKVRNVPDGERVEFAGATVVNPNSGSKENKSGFTGVATSNVVRFPDGKLRRLFIDVDPEKTGGFDALWVELEEDLAEALFAMVAIDPSKILKEEVSSMEFEKMIVYDPVSKVLNPLRGFAPDIIPRLCQWVMDQLKLDRLPLVSSVISEWVIQEEVGRSRVLLLELLAGIHSERTYCLLRRDGLGQFKVLIITNADWMERIRYWWNFQDRPPKDAGNLVASLVFMNQLWGEL